MAAKLVGAPAESISVNVTPSVLFHMESLPVEVFCVRT